MCGASPVRSNIVVYFDPHCSPPSYYGILFLSMPITSYCCVLALTLFCAYASFTSYPSTFPETARVFTTLCSVSQPRSLSSITLIPQWPVRAEPTFKATGAVAGVGTAPILMHQANLLSMLFFTRVTGALGIVLAFFVTYFTALMPARPRSQVRAWAKRMLKRT